MDRERNIKSVSGAKPLNLGPLDTEPLGTETLGTQGGLSQESATNKSVLGGILFMLAGMFLFAAVDTIAKYLTSSFNPVQIMWTRQLGLAFGVAVFICIKGFKLFETDNRKLQIARGLAATGSGLIFIIAIKYVPLADAVAVSFVAPFMVTIMGALFLREKVGIRRWLAISIGFIGTLIVIRPGTGALHPAVFLVIIAASLFALRQILSRRLSGGDTTTTTIAYTAFVSFGLLSLYLPVVWVTPEWGTEMLLLLALAAVAALSEYCVIRALELAQAVIIAPIHYSMIIWGTMYGYFIFGDLPDLWTWVGALIIAATGLYTVRREHLLAKAKLRELANTVSDQNA